jgi:hypothetical protein
MEQQTIELLQKITDFLMIIAGALLACFFLAKYVSGRMERKRQRKAKKMASLIHYGALIEFECERTNKKRRGYIVSLNRTSQYCTVRVSTSHRLESVDYHNIYQVITDQTPS